MKGSLPHLQNCQKLQYLTSTASSEDSKPIETSQVPTDFNKSRCVQDLSEDKPVTEFESMRNHGEQIIFQDNKLLSNNFKVEIQNQKLTGP